MDNRQRTGVPWLALALVPALVSALCLARPVSARGANKRTPGASSATKRADSGAMVVATVNGEKITRAEVANDLLDAQETKLTATNPLLQDKSRPAAASIGALVLKRMMANGHQPVTITRADIVDWLFKDKPDILVQSVQRLVYDRVILQAAKKDGVTLTPGEIDAQVTKTINIPRTQMHLQGTDDQILAQYGMRKSFLRQLVQIQLLRDKLVEKLVRKDIATKAGHPIGDNDYLAASHILVNVQTDPANQANTEKNFADAKTKILALADEIKSGKKTFEDVARDTNQDSTKFQGGSLGIFLRGQMVPEFDKVAFTQEKGKIGEPVRTQFGWHLIRVDRTGKELTAPEKQQLFQTEIQKRTQAKVTELMAKATIVNRVEPPKTQGMLLPGRAPRGPAR